MKIRTLLAVAIVGGIAGGMKSEATHGINLIGVGPVQQGTAGAGMASAKDSTWLILNPAGLTDIQPSFDASLQVFAPVRKMDSTMSMGAGEQRDDSMFVIPQISGSFGCCHAERGFVGIGMYGTSGMGVDYDDGRMGNFMTGRPQSHDDQMTSLSIAKMTLTYAYKFGDEPGKTWSIGAGPVLVYSRFKTDMYHFTAMGPASSYESWDDAWGGGAIVGVTKHFGRVSIGASYLSKQWMGKFDKYDTLFGSALNLPQEARAGLAWNVLDNLELAFDYQWIDWSGVDTFDQFGWDSQNIYKLGATWGVTDALTLRTGLSYGKTPVDRSNAFANALFPAIMEMHFSCGFTYAWEKWAVNCAYTHAFKESVTADGKLTNSMMPGMGSMVAGTKIQMYQNSLTLGVTRHF